MLYMGNGNSLLKGESMATIDYSARAKKAWETRRAEGGKNIGTKIAKKAWRTMRKEGGPDIGTKMAKKAWKTRKAKA